MQKYFYTKNGWRVFNMQGRHSSVLRSINNSSNGCRVCTFGTHERSQANWATLPYHFYLLEGAGLKKWENLYSPLPKNHTIINLGDKKLDLERIPNDLQFDIILSQSKDNQYGLAKKLSDIWSVPLISMIHTLPSNNFNAKRKLIESKMRGDFDVFITKFQKESWLWPDDNVYYIPCATDTDFFCPPEEPLEKDGKVLSVVNDFINRDMFCGYKIYQRVTNGLPTNPIGKTPGLSKPATGPEDLRDKYRRASVFLNTSILSTSPMSVSEAAACACPIVSTATCSLPEFLKDGVNSFCANDESYLREKLIWCLKNPAEAQKLGDQARLDAIKHYSLANHLNLWQNLVDKAYGSVHKS